MVYAQTHKRTQSDCLSVSGIGVFLIPYATRKFPENEGQEGM